LALDLYHSNLVLEENFFDYFSLLHYTKPNLNGKRFCALESIKLPSVKDKQTAYLKDFLKE
jgi:hypothetical protein